MNIKYYRTVLSSVLVLIAVFAVACGPTAAPTSAPAPTTAPAVQATAVPAAPTAVKAAPTAVPAAPTAAQSASSGPSQALIDAAKAEGQLTVVAVPDDWLNYAKAKADFQKKYGIKLNDLDPQAGSADEINYVKNNKDSKGPQNPDVLDVGYAFGPQLVSEGLCQPYKPTTWDTIPTGLKESTGCWFGDYYGVFAFAVNKSVVKNVPQDWADLQKPEYKNSIAIAGDPLASNQAQQSIFAAGLANGGTLTDPSKGLEFFANLAKAGNFVPLVGSQGSLAKGETPILITWDYLALGYADILKGNPEIAVVVPKTGVFGGVYVMSISKYAPHPNAAKLWVEYLYSDEGQLVWLSGFGHPIRYDDLAKRGVIPADMAKKLPSADLYSKAVFPTGEQVSAARKFIGDNWDKVVGVKVNKGQ